MRDAFDGHVFNIIRSRYGTVRHGTARYGTERNEKFTVTRQERNFHCKSFEEYKMLHNC